MGQDTAARHDNPRLGILLMILTSLVFALQDGVSRHLASQYSVITVVAVRFWFLALFTLALSASRPGGIRAVARSAHPWLQLLRGVLLVAEICVVVVAFVHLGLIETHAIFAAYPLLVAALAGPMLGEYVGWRRGLAILVGLIGMLVILRPGIRVFSPAAVLPLVGALMFAVYALLTRRVAWGDSAGTTFFYTGTIGAAAATLVVPFAWTPIHGTADWLWMGTLCATAALGHFLMIKAYSVAEAGTVQPFAYFQLVFIVILGLAFFGERPDAWTYAGGAVILGAGLYTLIREARLGRTRR